MKGKQIGSGPLSAIRVVLAAFLAFALLPMLPAVAQERDPHRERPRPTGIEEFHELLDGLERGMVALRRLGRHEELEALEHVANAVRREIAQERERPHREGDKEREIARHQIEALKLALPALREAGKEDAADLIHYAIRAREVGLEGRRDEEARLIRKRAPDRELTVKLLVIAEELYREWGDEKRAAAISRMTEKLWQRRDRKGPGRERPEKDRLRRQIEIMKMAGPALLEADRKDTFEILEHAIHARELALQGRTDREAIEIRESAPNIGQQVEILKYAAGLWKKFGNQDKAELLHELAQDMWAHRERPLGERREKEREHRRETEREIVLHQIEVMEIARHGLLEAERREAAEVMTRAIQVRQVNLKGLRGEEANLVRERAPSLGQQVEILGLAAKTWREFGNHDKAEVVGQLAKKMWAQAKKRKERARSEREREHGSVEQQLERLHGKIAELQRALEGMKRELRALKQSHY